MSETLRSFGRRIWREAAQPAPDPLPVNRVHETPVQPAPIVEEPDTMDSYDSIVIEAPATADPGPQPLPCPVALEYDEDFYLKQHEDVAAAVARGDWPSGMTHWAVAGRAKGRVAAPEVDEAWYMAAYPLARQELAEGRVSSARQHYFAIGRYRGYLPDAKAKRPDNPAATRSRFGGLWTDHGNAMDIVAGRRDLGWITEEQAQLLGKWITDGYVVLPTRIPEPLLDAAEAELDRAYHGQMPELRFGIHGIGQNTEWAPEALTLPAKALDMHWFSQAIRDLIFADPVLDFLHLVFERRSLASQTLGFWRGSAQDAHQDSAYVNYSLPMQFAASWIALEDVRAGAGELFYHLASHNMPDFLYGSEFKGAEESKRVMPERDLSSDYVRHINLIQMEATGLAFDRSAFLAKRGEVLVWSADLGHGGSPISTGCTRKSVVTHYCPREATPLFFETKGNMPYREYNGRAFFSSSLYES
jgi:hypothetical protein